MPQRADRHTPVPAGTARVKGCGKSAPRDRRRKRQGKPHPEQDRIGAARWQQQVCFGPDRPGWSLERRSNASPRGMAAPADTVSLQGYRRPDRTRLTGSPVHLGPKAPRPGCGPLCLTARDAPAILCMGRALAPGRSRLFGGWGYAAPWHSWWRSGTMGEREAATGKRAMAVGGDRRLVPADCGYGPRPAHRNCGGCSAGRTRGSLEGCRGGCAGRPP